MDRFGKTKLAGILGIIGNIFEYFWIAIVPNLKRVFGVMD